MKVWKFIITKLTNAKPQKQKQTTPPPKKKPTEKTKQAKQPPQTTKGLKTIYVYIKLLL